MGWSWEVIDPRSCPPRGSTTRTRISAQPKLRAGLLIDIAKHTDDLAEVVIAGRKITRGPAASDTNIVYRGLAEGEDIMGGLVARNPKATISPASHVAGKIETQWISTTKDLDTAISKYGDHGVVAIDLSKVTGEVVDLSSGIPGHNPCRFCNWAIKDQEVLIQGGVPESAIRRIG